MTRYNTVKLVDAAKEARKYSRARYSGFKVGAALTTDKGEIITGANIESSSYGLTICAERVALTKALTEGKDTFKAIAIAANDGDYCPPCGACRQLLFDYAPDIDVILTDGHDHKIYKLRDLLPVAFEDSKLSR